MDPRNPSGEGGRRRPRPATPRPGRDAAARLRAVPPAEPAPAQDEAFPIRLDPNSPPGEFNFILPQGQASGLTAKVPAAATDGPVPPVLVAAVDEVLGFLFGLDQPSGKPKRP